MKVSINDFAIIKKNLKENTKTKILSSSMEPYIYKGDIIKVSPVTPNDLRTGDPIVFWSKNMLVCHFLIKKIYKENNLMFLTKGLGNDQFDELIKEEQLLGVVTIPRIPKWKRFLFSTYFKIILRKKY